MRREATTHAGSERELAKRLANSRGRPRATLRRTVDDAKQRSDAQGDTEAQPRVELFPRPPVHADLASLAAFASADEDRAAVSVEITLSATAKASLMRSPAGLQAGVQQPGGPPSGRSPLRRPGELVSTFSSKADRGRLQSRRQLHLSAAHEALMNGPWARGCLPASIGDGRRHAGPSAWCVRDRDGAACLSPDRRWETSPTRVNAPQRAG
jgi:hypothetical protein